MIREFFVPVTIDQENTVSIGTDSICDRVSTGPHARHFFTDRDIGICDSGSTRIFPDVSFDEGYGIVLQGDDRGNAGARAWRNDSAGFDRSGLYVPAPCLAIVNLKESL